MKVTYKKFANIARLRLFANLIDLGETGEKDLTPDVETLFIAYMAGVVGNLKINVFEGEDEVDIDLDTLPEKMAKAVRKTEDNTPIMDAGPIGPLMFLGTAIMTGRIIEGIVDDLKKEEESNGNS